MTSPLPTFSLSGPAQGSADLTHPSTDGANDCCMWACWLGHSTVLIYLAGTWILTDPVLFGSYGLRILGLTLGPHRITPPALGIDEIPKPDIVLLSHAHLDHMDRQTLSAVAERWSGEIDVITAANTRDVIDDLPWRSLNEMDWGDGTSLHGVSIGALQVRHNGWRIPGEPCRANGQRKSGRSYNGYLLEKNGARIVFGGDTAYTNTFASIANPIDLAIMPIGAYDPYPDTHCTPEESLAMTQMMGARAMLPIHHSTFCQSEEPISDPMRRLRIAIERSSTSLAITGIGGTYGVARG